MPGTRSLVEKEREWRRREEVYRIQLNRTRYSTVQYIMRYPYICNMYTRTFNYAVLVIEQYIMLMRKIYFCSFN